MLPAGRWTDDTRLDDRLSILDWVINSLFSFGGNEKRLHTFFCWLYASLILENIFILESNVTFYSPNGRMGSRTRRRTTIVINDISKIFHSGDTILGKDFV